MFKMEGSRKLSANLLVALVAIVLVFHEAQNAFCAHNLSPVILVPGYGGSKLEAQWHQADLEHPTCQRSTDWKTIWVDYTVALPGRLECLIDMLELERDNKTGLTHNKPGLSVRVKDPGQVESVEFLTDHKGQKLFGFVMFHDLVQRLVGVMGYTRNVNIRGGPYDFRRAPNELEQFFTRLQSMVEEMFVQAHGIRVTLVCHSMGCLNSLHFLHQLDAAWKNKYIRRLVAIGAPWGGSVKSLLLTSIGFDVGVPLLPSIGETMIRRVARSFPSTYLLFPNARVFGHEPLVETNLLDPAKVRNFTANDYEQLLTVDKDQAYEMWKQVNGLVDLSAPHVEVQCFCGQGHKTLARLRFEEDYGKSDWYEEFENGDAVVPLRSSSYCSQWQHEQEEPVETHFVRSIHMKMVSNGPLLHKLIEILRTP